MNMLGATMLSNFCSEANFFNMMRLLYASLKSRENRGYFPDLSIFYKKFLYSSPFLFLYFSMLRSFYRLENKFFSFFLFVHYTFIIIFFPLLICLYHFAVRTIYRLEYFTFYFTRKIFLISLYEKWTFSIFQKVVGASFFCYIWILHLILLFFPDSVFLLNEIGLGGGGRF